MSNKLPPKDSWIELKPGAEIRLDERLFGEWQKLTLDYRQIRGNFLAVCFEFEYVIDQIISEVLFPKADSPHQVDLLERRNHFDELLLKGGTIQFARKIDLLKQLHSRFPRLEEAISADVFPMLTKVREIRNKFAHYPITFEPLGEPPNQTVVPWLVTRHSRTEVGPGFIQEYSTLFSEVERALASGHKQLLGDGSTGNETIHGSP